MKHKILIIDDKINICQVLSDILQASGYDTVTALSGEEGLVLFGKESPDIILTDLKMEKMSGLEFIKLLRKKDEKVPVILLTAFGSISSAVEAIKSGANDYLTKPLHYDLLKIKIAQILDECHNRSENEKLKENLKQEWGLDNIIGKSAPMLKMFSIIKVVAPTDSGVLIQGECGTGKELIARSLYAYSRRVHEAFIVVDCSAIPESLIESELFGHEKGAFTGANVLKKGRIEKAAGGTLFLDEIGELPLSCQAKLLRVIQEKQFVRIGGTQQLEVDFRLIAATNKNLKNEVENKRFRSDLYYRLNVISINAPPLRDRMEDIPLLIDSFKKTIGNGECSPMHDISREHMEKLMSYNWPGNVRELKNCVERLMILDSLPAEIEEYRDRLKEETYEAESSEIRQPTLSVREKEIVREALESCGWNISKTAKTLGIGRKALYNRIKKYELTVP
ncbi:sigma-54-dependent transcriptional regulator [Oceanispirochaeta crateris]|uniref:sigma-54-dependent transcriptional regulator n=1 Tax=Oceanispirochaeta crateris TaxID=2518645 RepID=UPI00143E03D8|nr:sigma-54 dependent transcriptional regulator [Oceanispirochaeta crateris]